MIYSCNGGARACGGGIGPGRAGVRGARLVQGSATTRERDELCGSGGAEAPPAPACERPWQGSDWIGGAEAPPALVCERSGRRTRRMEKCGRSWSSAAKLVGAALD